MAPKQLTNKQISDNNIRSSMIRSMENHQHSGGDLNDDLEKAIAISLGNLPLDGVKPIKNNDIKKSSNKYKSNLYNGIEDISEEEQIKRLLELSKEESEKESEKVQTLADQISEEEQMKKILEISRRESEESPTDDINTVNNELKLYREKQIHYSETFKDNEERPSSSFSDDPAILKKSHKAQKLRKSCEALGASIDSIYMSDDESDDVPEEGAAASNNSSATSSGYKSLDNISLLGATARSPLKDSPISTIPLSSSSGSSGISEFMDDDAFNLWMSLSAEQRSQNLVMNKDTNPQARPSSPSAARPSSPSFPRPPQARPSSPSFPRPPQARPSSPVGPLSSFPTSSLESTAAHNRLATLTELQGDGSIVPQGMSEEDALQRAIEESKKFMSAEQATGRTDWTTTSERGRGHQWTATDIVPKGLSEDELIKRALEESKKDAFTNIRNPHVDLNYPGTLLQDSLKDLSSSSSKKPEPVMANTGAKPKKRGATSFIPSVGQVQRNSIPPVVQAPQAQRSSTPPFRNSWEETGARMKPRNGMSKSPEPQGRRSNSNPGLGGYNSNPPIPPIGGGYIVEGMSEEEQLALALSQSRLEAPPPPPSGVELREVVVDGSNVGMAHAGHNNKPFSVKGISICVEYFKKRGYKIIVMMPRHRWSRATPQEKETLDALESRQILFYTPGRKTPTNSWTCYDDRFIVEYAATHGAVVLSNDNYRDLKDEPKFKDTIENRILPYTWVFDDLMLPDDPMGRHGPKLEVFLRK